MNKKELISVFNDTMDFVTAKFSGPTLRAEMSTQIISDPEDFRGEKYYDEPAIIKVTNRDTFTAAKEYANITNSANEGFVGVLNFASSTNPGGGVTKGSTAQEECLCRCSNLYPVLHQEKCIREYYNINKKYMANLGSDAIIYSRNIYVFKDKNYNMLPAKDRFYVDVITCAAPNLRENPRNQYNDGASKEKITLTDEELYNIHVKRARNILNVAIKNEDDYLILGAFGCGAFKNNPEIVAKAYKDVLQDYIYCFKVIDFAIIDGKYSNNYEVFKRILLQ
jgi:uncharacterized protein (TIGR02452 family)